MICEENAKEHAPCTSIRCPMDHTTNIDTNKCKNHKGCPFYTPKSNADSIAPWQMTFMVLVAMIGQDELGESDLTKDNFYKSFEAGCNKVKEIQETVKKESNNVRNPEQTD